LAREHGGARVLEILPCDIDRVLALGGWGGIAQVDRSALMQTLTPPGTPTREISEPAELPARRRVVAAS
jgi:hypothetical protein